MKPPNQVSPDADRQGVRTRRRSPHVLGSLTLGYGASPVMAPPALVNPARALPVPAPVALLHCRDGWATQLSRTESRRLRTRQEQPTAATQVRA